MSRIRATLDLIERSESQPYYQELYETFKTVRLDATGFDQLHNPTNTVLIKQRRDVIAFLNHYELIALGCDVGVLDEGFYKSWMRTAVARDWKAAKKFVDEMRNPTKSGAPGHPTAYTHLEALVLKWERDSTRRPVAPENSP